MYWIGIGRRQQRLLGVLGLQRRSRSDSLHKTEWSRGSRRSEYRVAGAQAPHALSKSLSWTNLQRTRRLRNGGRVDDRFPTLRSCVNDHWKPVTEAVVCWNLGHYPRGLQR